MITTFVRALSLSAGVTALADAIPDMGALTQLDISENTLGAEGGKNLAEALNGNQVMTSLNVSSNYLAKSRPGEQNVSDMSGLIALANTIKDMGALVQLDISAEMTSELSRRGISSRRGIELAK